MDLIREITNELIPKKDLPKFKAGDNVTVHYKIREGNKERIQQYKGTVIQVKGGKNNPNRMFTVRKMSGDIGVERIFPIYSPNIDKIEFNKEGKVRRARLFYLRELTGKKSRIKEKKHFRKEA